MNICCIYLFLSVNLVATAVAYYKKCYEEFSLCLITNTEDPRDAWRNQFILTRYSAVEWCSNNSSTLAIITNETVQSAIEAFIDDSSAKLNNSDIVTNGYRFSLANWEWINGSRSNLYPNVYSYQNRYACLEVAPHRTYFSWSNLATDRKKFICSYVLPRSTSNNVRCRVGFQKVGIRCYKIRNEVSTWFDARSICIEKEEGSDLAILESGNLSVTFESRNNTQYWIGLRKERWSWYLGRSYHSQIIYSNWEDESPKATTVDNCLCLRVATGKWTDCSCSLPYRYVCIQDYVSGSESSTTKPTNTTTTPPTKAIKATTTKLPITSTPSTTTVTPTVRTSSSLFHSTPTQALDDNLWNKTSVEQVNPIGSETFPGILVALGIGSVCLLILITVIVVVVVIKHRRCRSGGNGPKPSDSPSQTVPDADSPNSVYATVVPNANEPTRSASDKIQNQIVYAELELVTPNSKITLRASKAVGATKENTPNETVYAEVGLVAPKAKIVQRNSKPVGSSVEKTQNQMVYAELDLVPKQGNKRGRSGLKSENPNGIQLESVYANSTQN